MFTVSVFSHLLDVVNKQYDTLHLLYSIVLFYLQSFTAEYNISKAIRCMPLFTTVEI